MTPRFAQRIEERRPSAWPIRPQDRTSSASLTPPPPKEAVDILTLPPRLILGGADLEAVEIICSAIFVGEVRGVDDQYPIARATHRI